MKIKRLLERVILALGTIDLSAGAALYLAAYATGAAGDYDVKVTWYSAFASVLWPPWRILSLALHLVPVGLTVALTAVMFLRLRRWLAVVLLFVEVVIVHQVGGWLGLYFLLRQLTTYHFSIDGEMLGEYWYVYQSLAVWELLVLMLAFVALFPAEHRGSSFAQPPHAAPGEKAENRVKETRGGPKGEVSMQGLGGGPSLKDLAVGPHFLRRLRGEIVTLIGIRAQIE